MIFVYWSEFRINIPVYDIDISKQNLFPGLGVRLRVYCFLSKSSHYPSHARDLGFNLYLCFVALYNWGLAKTIYSYTRAIMD